jgi:hypothetical protein
VAAALRPRASEQAIAQAVLIVLLLFFLPTVQPDQAPFFLDAYHAIDLIPAVKCPTSQSPKPHSFGQLPAPGITDELSYQLLWHQRFSVRRAGKPQWWMPLLAERIVRKRRTA